MIRRPPRSTLFPYTDALPISGHEHPTRLVDPHLLDLRIVQPPLQRPEPGDPVQHVTEDRKSTRLNSSHANISYAVFCLKKKKKTKKYTLEISLMMMTTHTQAC